MKPCNNVSIVRHIGVTIYVLDEIKYETNQNSYDLACKSIGLNKLKALLDQYQPNSIGNVNFMPKYILGGISPRADVVHKATSIKSKKNKAIQ